MLLFVLVAALLLGPLYTRAGDEDREPAYLIYIDPETGRYTTRDPAAGHDGPSPGNARGDSTRAKPDERSPNMLQIISAASVALVLFFAGIKVVRRRRVA